MHPVDSSKKLQRNSISNPKSQEIVVWIAEGLLTLSHQLSFSLSLSPSGEPFPGEPEVNENKVNAKKCVLSKKKWKEKKERNWYQTTASKLTQLNWVYFIHRRAASLLASRQLHCSLEALRNVADQKSGHLERRDFNEIIFIDAQRLIIWSSYSLKFRVRRFTTLQKKKKTMGSHGSQLLATMTMALTVLERDLSHSDDRTPKARCLKNSVCFDCSLPGSSLSESSTKNLSRQDFPIWSLWL